jgi:hypothetical protein
MFFFTRLSDVIAAAPSLRHCGPGMRRAMPADWRSGFQKISGFCEVRLVRPAMSVVGIVPMCVDMNDGWLTCSPTAATRSRYRLVARSERLGQFALASLRVDQRRPLRDPPAGRRC